MSLLLLMLLLVASACSTDSASGEEDYPKKDVEFIVPFSAGGTSDLNARLIEQYFQEYVGTRSIITYKPGAGGEIGFTDIAKSKPDGYTIGAINTPHIVLQPMGRETQFDENSFDYIAQLVSDPIILAVKNDSDIQDLEHFLQIAEEKPGTMTVGIVGTLTGGHLGLLKMVDETGIQVTEVPFPGSADNTAALLGGHVQAIIGNVGDVAQDLDQYNILGIMAEERHEWIPDVPTFQEKGHDVFQTIRRGLAAPTGLPEPVLAQLQESIAEIVAKDEYLEGMVNIGLPEQYLSGEEFRESIMQEKIEAEELLKKYDLID